LVGVATTDSAGRASGAAAEVGDCDSVDITATVPTASTVTPVSELPPLRIALISPYSLTIPGGVQGQVMGLARELRAMGHEARVLGPCDGAPPATFVTPLGNSLPTAANGSIAPLAPDPACALRTIRALRDEEFDVLHLHEPLAPGPTVTALVVRPAPVIGTFHAAGDSASYRYLNGPVRWVAAGLDHRVAVSKDALELVDRYLGGEYEVLFNGVELERFRTAAPAPGGERAVFFCGRHEERKGLEVLLRAHATLPADVTLWIASDGPDTARLQREFAGDHRITWLGRITDDEKIARLRGAAAFCAPSLHGESFGVVLLEAMAAGTPVVASSLDGYRNVATDEVDALLTPPGDHLALARALGRVLDESGTADHLREGGRRRAGDFSMHRLAELYLERYRVLVARGPRRERESAARRTRLRRMIGA
jgi:phosphatidylinositol alpha-mannosyltransferase